MSSGANEKKKSGSVMLVPWKVVVNFDSASFAVNDGEHGIAAVQQRLVRDAYKPDTVMRREPPTAHHHGDAVTVRFLRPKDI